MAEEGNVENPGELIRFGRWLRGFSQEKLADRTGMEQAQISRYETGDDVPRLAQRQRIAAALRMPLRIWGFIGHSLQLIRKAITSGATIAAPHGRGDGGEVREAVWQAVERALALARAELAFVRGAKLAEQMRPPTEEENLVADSRVERLRGCSEAKQRLLIDGAASFRSWIVCLRLCAASERASADEPAEALRLAELAHTIAARVPGTDGWRTRLQGYCGGFVGSAQKAANELQMADETMTRARARWEAGEDKAGVLPKAQLVDREAALRTAQRRFGEALKLHDSARALARPEELGYILLNKSVTLGEMGDNEGSIAVLEEAAREIDRKRQPRLFFGVRFNLASNLLRLHRAQEAEPIVREVRKLVKGLGNEADSNRVRWLEGNLCAGLGQREEAVAALEEVRRGFAAMPFDHALASLDLALVYRAEGRVAEVQRLAVEMLEVFEGVGVHREAIAAVMLFRDAAERGAVTEELVRRLQDFLAKARGNRGLRFAG